MCPTWLRLHLRGGHRGTSHQRRHAADADRGQQAGGGARAHSAQTILVQLLGCANTRWILFEVARLSTNCAKRTKVSATNNNNTLPRAQRIVLEVGLECSSVGRVFIVGHALVAARVHLAGGVDLQLALHRRILVLAQFPVVYLDQEG